MIMVMIKDDEEKKAYAEVFMGNNHDHPGKKKVYEVFSIIGLHHPSQAILHRCRVTGETVDLAQVKKAHPLLL